MCYSKAHSAAPPSGAHEQSTALAHAGAQQMFPGCMPLSPILTGPWMGQTLTWETHSWEGVCRHADEQRAHRLEPEKQGARSAPNTGCVVLADSRALIRGRKTGKSVPETEDGHGFLRWDGFFIFFSKCYCRLAPVAISTYHAPEKQ